MSNENSLPPEHDLTAPDFYIDDFEHDDLVFLSSSSGIAINLTTGRVLLFQSTLGRWKHERYTLADIRNAEESAPVADHYTAIGQANAGQNIGQNIRAAAQNASAQARASSQTGIIIALKSTALPEFLVQVVDTPSRKSLIEALRQVLQDGALRTPFRVIPDEVKDFYYRPTASDLVEKAAREQRHKDRKKATYIRVWEYGLVTVLALGFVVLAWGIYKSNVPPEVRSFSVSTLEDFILYSIGMIVVCILALKAWKNIRFLMLAR